MVANYTGHHADSGVLKQVLVRIRAGAGVRTLGEAAQSCTELHSAAQSHGTRHGQRFVYCCESRRPGERDAPLILAAIEPCKRLGLRQGVSSEGFFRLMIVQVGSERWDL